MTTYTFSNTKLTDNSFHMLPYPDGLTALNVQLDSDCEEYTAVVSFSLNSYLLHAAANGDVALLKKLSQTQADKFVDEALQWVYEYDGGEVSKPEGVEMHYETGLNSVGCNVYEKAGDNEPVSSEALTVFTEEPRFTAKGENLNTLRNKKLRKTLVLMAFNVAKKKLMDTVEHELK